jgi:asparagine synthetase B (glutamine-hydrolysing)
MTETMRGVWAPGMRIRQRETFAPGLGTMIRGDAHAITLRMDDPGVHALHYIVSGNRLFWDESEWRLRRRVRQSKCATTGKFQQLQGGEEYRFNGIVGSLGKYAIERPTILPMGMAEATDALAYALPRAVDDILKQDKAPITVLLSGGVDSISTLWALKEAGAEGIECITVGRDMRDFDPQWAQRAAKHFGIPWRLIELPYGGQELDDLVRDTVGIIEQTSFSNVLMGCCCTLIQRDMVERGRKIAWLGYEADALLGNKMLLVGQHRALALAAQTDTAWSRARQDACWYVSPYTMQLAKNLRFGGETDWRTPFLHPTISRLLLALPKEAVPPTLEKPLLYALMDRVMPEGLRPWHVKKKIGFYTGAGIGNMRLTEPILQDPNIRWHYGEQKKRLT